MKSALWFTILLAGAGCSTGITGSIDGIDVQIRDRCLVHHDSLPIVYMQMLSIDDGCDALAGYFSDLEQGTSIASAHDSAFPEHFWWFTLVIASDPDVDITGEKFSGIFRDQETIFAGEMQMVASWRDVPYDAGENLFYVSDLGNLNLNVHKPGERLSGYGRTDMYQTTTDDFDPYVFAGDIRFRFTGAKRHLELEEALAWTGE